MQLAAIALIGIGLGYVFARGQFCLASAFRQALLYRAFRAVGGVALAATIVLAGRAVLFALDDPLPPIRNDWPDALIGGALFGFGMAVAGGCISSVLFRAGSGDGHFLITFASLALGAALQRAWIAEPVASGRTLGSSLYAAWPGTSPLLLGGGVLLVVVGGSILLVGGPRRLLRALAPQRDPAARAGRASPAFPLDPILTGALVGGLLLLVALCGGTIGFGGGVARLTEFAAAPASVSLLNGQAALLLATLLGASLAARRMNGTWKLRAPRIARLPSAVGGGLAMGIGAGFAPGCNVGVLLGDLPALASHGVVVGGSMIAAFSATTLLMARRG